MQSISFFRNQNQTAADGANPTFPALFFRSTTDVQARTMPIRFWLIQLSAPVGSKREMFYAVVLPSGSIVIPTAARKPAAAAALVDRDTSALAIDPALTAPANKIEIHGEISFTYGFGKGSGCANRYLNPSWYSPSWQRDIEP